MHCGDKLWPFLSIMRGSKVATSLAYFCLWFSFIFKLIQKEKVVRETNMKSMRDWCGINAGRFRLCSCGVEQLNSSKPARARQARNVTFWNVLQVAADIQCFIWNQCLAWNSLLKSFDCYVAICFLCVSISCVFWHVVESFKIFPCCCAETFVLKMSRYCVKHLYY